MKRTSPHRMTKQRNHRDARAPEQTKVAGASLLGAHPSARALRLYWASLSTRAPENARRIRSPIRLHLRDCAVCTLAIEALDAMAVLTSSGLHETVTEDPIQLAAAALPRATATQMLAPGDGTSVARTRTYEIVLFFPRDRGKPGKAEARLAIYTAADQIVRFRSDAVVPTLEAVGYFEGTLVRRSFGKRGGGAQVVEGTLQIGEQRRHRVTFPLPTSPLP